MESSLNSMISKVSAFLSIENGWTTTYLQLLFFNALKRLWKVDATCNVIFIIDSDTKHADQSTVATLLY